MGAVASTVAARFAFFPPTPPSYGVELPPPPPAAAAAPAAGAAAAEGEEVKEKGGGGGGGSRVVELTGVPRRGNVEARRLRTKRGTEVVAMHVRQPGAKLTLLYSHGNAADLGQMLGLFLELRAHLRVNIMRSETENPHASVILHRFCSFLPSIFPIFFPGVDGFVELFVFSRTT